MNKKHNLSLKDIENMLREYAKTNPAPYPIQPEENQDQSNLTPEINHDEILRKIKVQIKRIKDAKSTHITTNDQSPNPNE